MLRRLHRALRAGFAPRSTVTRPADGSEKGGGNALVEAPRRGRRQTSHSVRRAVKIERTHAGGKERSVSRRGARYCAFVELISSNSKRASHLGSVVHLLTRAHGSHVMWIRADSSLRFRSVTQRPRGRCSRGAGASVGGMEAQVVSSTSLLTLLSNF